MRRMRYLPLAFGAIALAMVCASLFSPWYYHTLRDGPNEAGDTFDSNSRYSLFGISSYEEKDDSRTYISWSDYNYVNNYIRLNTFLVYLVIIGIGLAVAVVGACLLALRKGGREIASALALALAAWCLFMPFYYMGNMAAHSASSGLYTTFWGGQVVRDHDINVPGDIRYMDYDWGPDVGWYLALLAGIFGFLAFAALVVPRPRPGFARAWRRAAVAVMAVLCLMSSAVALYPEPPAQEGDDWTIVGCRTEAIPGGDWLINITSGRNDPKAVNMLVIDPATGTAILSAKISSGTASNPDFTWTDWSGNNKLDAGDSILLRGTINGQPNPKIQDGFKVQFMKNNHIIGTIKELPPH